MPKSKPIQAAVAEAETRVRERVSSHVAMGEREAATFITQLRADPLRALGRVNVVATAAAHAAVARCVSYMLDGDPRPGAVVPPRPLPEILTEMTEMLLRKGVSFSPPGGLPAPSAIVRDAEILAITEMIEFLRGQVRHVWGAA